MAEEKFKSLVFPPTLTQLQKKDIQLRYVIARRLAKTENFGYLYFAFVVQQFEAKFCDTQE